MQSKRNPTLALLAGLVVTLSAVTVYSAYTITQLRSLHRLQTETIDRNRIDSLLLLRIQNNLNSLALAMRDMLDPSDGYPLIAWQGQFRRIRTDLDDALAREAKLSPAATGPRRMLSTSVEHFWDATGRIFALAQSNREEEARIQIRLSLEARQEALTTAVARLLVQNNEGEQQAAAQAEQIHAGVERNVYLFLGAMLILIVASSLYLVHYNRQMFNQVAALSERRSELAQQLITMQENTLRYVARDLHDDFGQILTAIGVMLQRAGRGTPAELQTDLQEVREIVQATLEKVRTLSKALHPVLLDDAGFEGALNVYLPGFEKQTGIAVEYRQEGTSRPLDRDLAIHLYRILQEALNNVSRHSTSTRAEVRLRYLAEAVILEVEDHGIGFGTNKKNRGMGLISMQERAGLMSGRIEFLPGVRGGALVRLTVPLTAEQAHV